MGAVALYLKPNNKREKERLLQSLEKPVVIGRGQSADVQLKDFRCDNLHALIEFDSDKKFYRLIDLGSHYGTYVNNRRIQEHPLRPGESFRIGSHQFSIQALKSTEEKPRPLRTEMPKTLERQKPTKEDLVTAKTLLQTKLSWGEKVLDVRTFNEGAKVTLGAQKEATFILPLKRSKEVNAPFCIASYEHGQLQLTLPLEVHGLVWIGNATYSIDALRHEDKDSSDFRDLSLTLRVGDRAHLEVDELSLEFQFVSPADKIPLWTFRRPDPGLLKWMGGLTAVFFLVLLAVLFAPIKEKEQTLDDVSEKLKKVVYDAGIADALKKQQAAIGELAANLEGGRARGEEGQATARKAPTPAASQAAAQPPPSPTTNTSQPQPEKVNFDAAFNRTSETPVTEAPSAVGMPTTGNTVSAIANGSFARGSKGLGAGGGGQSVGIGQLKGLSTGGGMGAGDYGLAPSKGREVEVAQTQDIEIMGGLDPDVIAAIIKRYLPQVRHCYEQHLSQNPNLKGKVKVAFTIGPQGNVADSSVVESTLKHAATEACIIAKTRTWQFPKPRGGGTVGVRYPFLLMSNTGQ